MTARRWLVFGVALMAMLTGGIAPTVSQAAGPNGADPHAHPHLAVQQGRHLTMAQLPAGLARVWRQTALRDHLAGSGLARTGAARLAAHSLSNFASTFAAVGPALHPLARSIRWSFSMTLAGYGRSSLHAVPRAQQTTHASLTTYRHGRLLEWYRTTRSGLEQGFTLPAAPAHAGHGPVVLSLHIGGSLHAMGTGHEIVLASHTGAAVLHYGGLRATDAHARTLPAHLATDGNTVRLVVDDRGAQYPLHIDPYIQGQQLVASDASQGNHFGYALALSDDGNTALIGASDNVVNGQFVGAAYVFVRPSGGTAWTQQQEMTASDAAGGDQFGNSVALSSDGNTALIGAADKTVNGQTNAGAAYVFVRPSGGATWTQQQELTATDPAYRDYFGSSAALSGDGNTALIGEVYRTVNQQQSAGTAYVFVRPSGGTAWTRQQETTASDAAYGDNFGSSVAMSDDGNTVLIGAPYKTVNGQQLAGAAYVFVRPSGGTAWTQQQELTASDAASYDRFGTPVALSDDGNTALIGAPYKTVNRQQSAGAAYVFVRPSGGATWTQQQELVDSNIASDDVFGGSAALTSDGNTALIRSAGAAYPETFTGTRASLSGQPTGCANGSTSPITVTLTPTAGATSTTYQLDSDPAQTYSGPFVVSGLGNHTITYHSPFSGGYVEPDQAINVQIAGPPTIALGRPSGSLGDTISVTGSVFQARETVSLYLDSTASTPLATVTAGDCSVSTSFSVPEATYGSHSIIAVGQSSGQTGSTSFSILPTTRILSSGSTFGLYGFGFGAGETVTVHLDSPTGTVVGSAVANSKGSFSPVIFSKPSISHRLYAVGQSTGATAYSLYVVPPSLSSNRSSGIPGSSASITGSNFGPGETVAALWNCMSASCTGDLVAGTATADSSGNVSIPITIPSTAMPGSSHTIGVLGQSTTAFGTLGFSLPPVGLLIDHSSGIPGSSATITGSNFGPGETVTALWDCTSASCTGATTVGTATSDSSGNVSIPITIPSTATPGSSHAIGVLGQSSKGFRTLGFSLPPVSLLIDHNSGIPGSSVTITGSNFGVGETVAALWNCSYPYPPCTGSQTMDTGTAEASGSVTIHATIPASATPGSTNTIGVLGQSSKGFRTLSFSLPNVSASINPGYGTAGSKATVSGSNYGAGEAVTAYFDCTAAPCTGKTAIGTANAASDGTLSLPATIPSNAAPGTTYTIGVLGSPSKGFTTVSYAVTGGPTVARVSGLALHRRGSTLLLGWRLAHPAGVLGFDLFAGATRLTAHTIPVHAAREYRFRTTQTTARRYTLQVILRNGQRIVIPFSAGR